MSYETWEKEFNPAEGTAKNFEEALEISMMQWIGLLPWNLKKHGVEFFSTERGRDCELCLWFRHNSYLAGCFMCPLVGCGERFGCDTLFGRATREGHISPRDTKERFKMIDTLAKLLDKEIRKTP